MRSIQFSHTANTLSAYLDPNMSHVRHPWSTHLLFSLQEASNGYLQIRC